jgi:hypothetical protein
VLLMTHPGHRASHLVGLRAGHRSNRSLSTDAAQWSSVRTAGSQARQPGGHPGGGNSIVRLIGRLAPASDRGV